MKNYDENKVMTVIPSCKYAVELEKDSGWTAVGKCDMGRNRCVGITCKFYKRK